MKDKTIYILDTAIRCHTALRKICWQQYSAWVQQHMTFQVPALIDSCSYISTARHFECAQISVAYMLPAVAWDDIKPPLMAAAPEAPEAQQCTYNIYRWQGTSCKQPTRNAVPSITPTPAADSEQHLQQIERLEKQLFSKGDNWARGGMFQQELNRRNTFLLYAVRVHEQQAQLTEQQEPQPQPHSQQQHQEHPPQQCKCNAGLILGYIVVQVNSITAHVNKLAVAPDIRRKGLGAALLRAALQVAIQERRALCSTLHVDTTNTAALALYSKAGFQRDGLVQDYYGSGKHAWKLLADLQESAAVAALVSAGSSCNGERS